MRPPRPAVRLASLRGETTAVLPALETLTQADADEWIEDDFPRLSDFAVPTHAQTTLAPAPVRPRKMTQRLADVGKMRPVVHIPAQVQRAGGRRTFKLPPVWVLTNAFILLALLIGFVPRLLPVDAASACTWYRVVPGDTLSRLSARTGISISGLAKANRIQNIDLIYIGQTLCIPQTDWAQANSAPAVPATSRPPTYASGSNVDRFIAQALPYARRAHEATGWPTSVILAQWGLEHGWAIPGFTGYNWGNTGAVPNEPVVAGTNVPGSPAAFAYAPGPEDGLRIYLRVSNLSYYRGVAPAARSGGADAAARALGRSPWDAGHYTDRGDPGSSLISIMRTFNLYWFDTH